MSELLTLHRDVLRKLYIEPTSFCNLQCRMCFRNGWIGESFGHLSLECVQALMEDRQVQDTVETVFFGGMGEPLFHPDIMEMIACAKSAGKRVELITNGSLLRDGTCEKLVELGLDKLWVSVDSFDPAHYETIQVGSRFGTVVRNLQRYNAARRGTASKLGITFVIMRSNLSQLRKFEEFIDFIEADDVNLSQMIPNTPDDEKETLVYLTLTAELLDLDKAYLDEITKEIEDVRPVFYRSGEAAAEAAVEKKNAALFRMRACDLRAFPEAWEILDENLNLRWRGKLLLRKPDTCRFVEEGHCFVRWDGDVSPCMGVLHSAKTYLHGQERTVWHHAFGNIHKAALSEIWNSPDYRQFRTRVEKFEFSPCTGCGGCDFRNDNTMDCLGNEKPTCGACLWGQGLARCP